ncbi:MAG: hypothetical protein A2898_03830 [Candidatus Kerfeldbacteria bacterium RIFCSPLOWO2_01_FULL_48_11]|uniref:Phosphoglycerate mutase n=1 Tax=Candidatus Kerfeldbacteria bacterium RIFCSPLOWO2_01_FULL_48_11 TaxID=1798543 RepID=A0A1G2B9E4_9BACT|nr:MAG: hypothetical protein A2898_03830 [Candidatus Kerfeldbacteria bacterium RIFCSPLOWO2_01_FULL_48_11]HCJ52605.1 hypothetical protein [Candidatus Kerfeldbacteria bacterium]HCM67543.1 hypothetical protein [Candidatus Kerfeldbacteria bacterium]
MPTSPESPIPIESREGEKERPNLTVFLMRHGESGKDKSQPTRGLTEKGREQVSENFNGLINQIIGDELPEFTDFDDPEKRQRAAQEALAKVEIHLADSETDRTMEQAWQEREMLINLGVPQEQVYTSQATHEWAKKTGLIPPDAATGGGPGVKRRLAGVQGMDQAPEFRKLIDKPEYQTLVGASDEIGAWARTPDDQVPAGVEKRHEMESRMDQDLATVQRVTEGRLARHQQRVVYVANSHASIITLAAAKELGIPLEQLGQVDNAEGLRMDFYSSGKQRDVRPFGKSLEVKVAEWKT